MPKTQAQIERQRRYAKKHPEKTISGLEKWISREKDPIKLAKAKEILEKYKKDLTKKLA